MSPHRQLGVSAALFLAVAVLWTWPQAWHPGELLLTCHFDSLPALWLSSAADDLTLPLSTGMSSWPAGESLRQADSFLLLVLAWGSGLDRGVLAWALMIFGPALSALAAERWAALHLGATWPLSILAGLAYGFSGIAATAVLEGHYYDLLAPWLPLLAWTWGLAVRPEGRAWHGLLAAVFWSLALLTSGYLGVCATLLVLFLLAPALWRRQLRWGPALAAASLALPVGLAYLALVAGPGGEGVEVGGPPLLAAAARGSASLTSLVSWYPTLDLREHSSAPIIGFTCLLLTLAAPRVLGRRGGWVVLALAALVATMLSLGAEIRLLPTLPAAPAPLGILLPDAALDWLRFPVRLAWVTALALGACAALVAARLAAGRAWLVAPLLACGLVDATLGNSLFHRGASVPLVVPSAYRQLDGPGAVLELWPEGLGAEKDLGNLVRGRTCSYQALHGRPLVQHCLLQHHNPDLAPSVAPWVQARLLAGQREGLDDILASMGIGWVILHPDLYPPGTRDTLSAGLWAVLGGPVAESRDGGEHVVAFRVDRSLATRGESTLPQEVIAW